MTFDYSALDAAILERITSPNRPKGRGGDYVPAFFMNIGNDPLVLLEARMMPGRGEAWRMINRRLQVLRKDGKIRYDHKAGWLEQESE